MLQLIFKSKTCWAEPVCLWECFSERLAQIFLAFCAFSRTAYSCAVLLSIFHGWFIEDNSLLNLNPSGTVPKVVSSDLQRQNVLFWF